MSHIPSLPLASRGIAENFVHRSEFWLQVLGNERDRFWEMDNPDRPYSYTAAEVVQFTEANCLVATAATNRELLDEFKTKLQTDWETNKTTPHEGMHLARLMSEYLVWIDHIFFFGVITHPTRRGGNLTAERPIITLQFENGMKDGDGNQLEGIFIQSTGELCVNMLQYSGEFQPFDKALCIIVHELVHVYLHVLTRDYSAGSYLRHVHQDNGHGVQFHELLQFILTQLFKLIPTITYLGELAADTRKDLQNALAKPSVSDAVARSLIYAEAATFKCIG